MSWGVVAGAVISAGAGYLSQKDANKQSAKNAKGAGQVNTTVTTASDPYTTPYRQGALDSAWGALTGQAPLSGGTAAPIQGNPNAAQSSGHGAVPAGYHVNARGQTVPVHNPANAAPGGGGVGAGGGGVGSGLPSTLAGKTGQSAATSSIIGRLNGLPAQNAQMNNAAETYSTNLLNGQSSNPLLDPATAAANNVGVDPRLSAFEDSLMGHLGVGGGGGSSAGNAAGGDLSGYFTSNGHGGAVPAGGGYGSSATGTDAALRDLVAGKDPAGWAAMQKSIEDSVNASRAESLRNLKGNAVQSGFYGGTGFDSMEAQAEAAGDTQLAGQLAQARFGAFQNALSLGTQYDTSMADVAAKNYATASSAGSSAAATAASLAAQTRGQDLGALGNALQLGEEGRYGTATNLGSLANLFSSDQKTALGGINDLAASRRNDLSAAGQLALGSDSSQNNLRSSAMSANASRANVNAQLAWQQQQFYDPLSRLGQFNDIMNGAFGNSGSVTTQGTDTRNSGGAAYSSPFGAALGGAAIGGQLGSMYNNYNNQQPVYSPTTGVVGSNPGATGGTPGNIW